MMHDAPNQTRLIARLVREALASQRFETMADLTDAVKTRAARLRIRVSPDAVGDAYRLIASNTVLVKDRAPEMTVAPAEAKELTAKEAEDALSFVFDKLRVRLGADGRVRPVERKVLALPDDAPANFPRLIPW